MRDGLPGKPHRALKWWKVALPLHPEFGTEPNVFYVPPFSSPATEGPMGGGPSRIPDEELEKLFGPGVKAALATLRAERDKRSKGQTSDLMNLLIAMMADSYSDVKEKARLIWRRERARIVFSFEGGLCAHYGIARAI